MRQLGNRNEKACFIVLTNLGVKMQKWRPKGAVLRVKETPRVDPEQKAKRNQSAGY